MVAPLGLSGQYCGRLLVIKFSHVRNTKRMWACRCSCGKELFVETGALRSGNTKSCGCLKTDLASLRTHDLAGKRFGDWLVIDRSPVESRNIRWLCECACGTRRDVLGYDLKSGKSKGCGCRKAEECSVRLTQHGLAHTPEYQIWHGMIRRCYNPRATGYNYYGGRGIEVCERWRNSFTDFLEDMGFRPSVEHTIDRIDFKGNYEPQNCRWATWMEQGQNTSLNHNLTFQGKTLCVSEWARVLGIKGSTLQNRLNRGWSVERALTEPTNHNKTS